MASHMTEKAQGHYLKAWRQYMQMSQAEFARYVGMSTSNYNYLETGRVAYTQKSLETIARALERSPADLLSINPLKPVRQFHDPEIQEFLHQFDRLTPDSQQVVVDLVSVMTNRQNKTRSRLAENIKKNKPEP